MAEGHSTGNAPHPIKTYCANSVSGTAAQALDVARGHRPGQVPENEARPEEPGRPHTNHQLNCAGTLIDRFELMFKLLWAMVRRCAARTLAAFFDHTVIG